MIRLGIDIGGVVSKYPDIFRALVSALYESPDVEIHFVSDMHPVEKIMDALERNDIPYHPSRVHSADYKAHGEACKAVVCRELGIDILIDDFIGYVAEANAPPVWLLVMPGSSRPYYHDDWITDGSEGDFGRRRNPAGSKRPPEDRSVKPHRRTGEHG